MTLGGALADLFRLHNFAVSADAALEGRSGRVYTVPLLAESDGRAVVVQCDVDSDVLGAPQVEDAAGLMEDVGADLAVLCHVGPHRPEALAAAGQRVILWGQDLLARLLGEAVLAQAIGGEPSPLPFRNPVADGPSLAESVSDLLPAAFKTQTAPAPAPAQTTPFPAALGAPEAEEPEPDLFAGLAEVIGIPLPGEDAPLLEALQATPAPAAPMPIPAPLQAAPAPMPATLWEASSVPSVAAAVSPAAALAAAPVGPASPLAGAAPLAAAGAFGALAAAAAATAVAPVPASTAIPLELEPLPFLPPGHAPAPAPAAHAPAAPQAAAAAAARATAPALAAAPLAPPAAPAALLPVRLTAEEAAKKVKDRLFGVTRHELVLQPVHLFDYECDLLAEGSLRTDTADGRVQVHGTDRACLTVDPDQVNPAGPTLLASTLGLQVVEKTLRVPAERAHQLATEHVVKAHTRQMDVQVKDTDSRYFYTEKRKVAPQADHVRLRHLGIFHRPVWRLWGSNGQADVDALDGKLLDAQVRNANSDSMLIE